jgi:hypothetical protein
MAKGNSTRYPSPALSRAAGAKWLSQFITGKRIQRIVEDEHRDRKTVLKYMKQAAALLIDKVHEDIITDVLPDVLKLYKAVLKQQLEMVEKGETVDLSAADRLLKGMFVLDSPQFKDAIKAEAAKEGDEASSETVETFVRRTRKQVATSKAIGVLTEGVIDAEVSSGDSKTSGRHPLQVTDGSPSHEEGEVRSKK